MTNLTEEQLQNRTIQRYKLLGRLGVVRNPYFTTIPRDTTVQLKLYDEKTDTFTALYSTKNPKSLYFNANAEITLDEINLIDKEFAGHSILVKGNRVERKDKFGDNFCIELIANKRDIYISSALISLLGLKDEQNYVGFAQDPENKTIYIFKSDEVNGYLLNKTNGRITSTADWRELSVNYNTTIFEVTPHPIVDNNNPGFIFYSMHPDFRYFSEPKQEIDNIGLATQKRMKNKPYGKKEAYTSAAALNSIYKPFNELNSVFDEPLRYWNSEITMATGSLKQIEEEIKKEEY